MLTRLMPTGYVDPQMLHRRVICKDYRSLAPQITHALITCGHPLTVCHPTTHGFGLAFLVMDLRTAQALIRFGLGRRGDEPLPADPSAWLRQQLGQPDPGLIQPRPSTANGLAALRDDRQSKPPPAESRAHAVFQAESRAELENALVTPAPFRERLVWFWTNHFTVSQRGGAAPVAGAFVEEAIRPHVTGRFEAMLFAVMHHPAMLIYLNNAGSVGPHSPAGDARPSRPEREPRPRMPGTPHGQPGRRLHPG